MNIEHKMIRPVKDHDASNIMNIYNHYITESTISFETVPLTLEQMQTRITDIAAKYPYFVSVSEEGILNGYCYAHAWKERAAYGKTLETTVYISEEYKNQGIGFDLMTRLIDRCREEGYRTLIACITANNTKSINFHKRLGFKQVSHFEKVGHKNGEELDVIDMQLVL